MMNDLIHKPENRSQDASQVDRFLLPTLVEDNRLQKLNERIKDAEEDHAQLRYWVVVAPAILFALLIIASGILWWGGWFASSDDSTLAQIKTLETAVAALQAEATVATHRLATAQSTEVPVSESTPIPEAPLPETITITLADLLLRDIRLAQFQGDAPQDIGAALETDAGTFSYTLPTDTARENVWLGYPQGWLVELAGVQGAAREQDGYVWRQLSATDQVISLLPDTAIKAHYTFSGSVYFQGFNAPEQVTVHLEKCDSNDSNCEPVVGPEPIARPAYTNETVEPVPFSLAYDVEAQNIYRVVIEVPSGEAQPEWLIGTLPENVNKSGVNSISITPSEFRPQTIANLQFGGPLPIVLDYTQARSGDTSYDLANLASPWKHDDRADGNPIHPYMTRTEEGQPSNLWVEWPLWLPSNEMLNLQVLLPDTENQSARATYSLVGNEGIIWASEPIRQCPQDNGNELAAGTFMMAEKDSLVKVRITDSDGEDDCGDFRTRLSIWQLRLGR